MVASLLLAALALASQPADMPATTNADPIAAAIVGLQAVIEDDMMPGRDLRLRSIATEGCRSQVVAEGRAWTIDWSKAESVALEDTFVFVAAPPVQFAIVGDASKPDQAAKLKALNDAMTAVARRCTADAR